MTVVELLNMKKKLFMLVSLTHTLLNNHSQPPATICYLITSLPLWFHINTNYHIQTQNVHTRVPFVHSNALHNL